MTLGIMFASAPVYTGAVSYEEDNKSFSASRRSAMLRDAA